MNHTARFVILGLFLGTSAAAIGCGDHDGAATTTRPSAANGAGAGGRGGSGQGGAAQGGHAGSETATGGTGQGGPGNGGTGQGGAGQGGPGNGGAGAGGDGTATTAASSSAATTATTVAASSTSSGGGQCPCPVGVACINGGCPLPDLTIDAGYMQSSLLLTSESFSPGSCEMIEGCVAAPGNRTLLRFALRTPNLGPGELLLGDPVGNPLFSYSPCHGHYHFNGYASYRLLDQSFNVVAVGHKQAFCLYDLDQYLPNADPPKYTCTYQGLTKGWADIYANNLSCQWVDVTGVPPGQYWLEVKVNESQTLAEQSYSNNEVLVPVSL
jgi:hypothetical protein